MSETEVPNLSLFQNFTSRVSLERLHSDKQHEHNDAHTGQVSFNVLKLNFTSCTIGNRLDTLFNNAVHLSF